MCAILRICMHFHGFRCILGGKIVCPTFAKPEQDEKRKAQQDLTTNSDQYGRRKEKDSVIDRPASGRTGGRAGGRANQTKSEKNRADQRRHQTRPYQTRRYNTRQDQSRPDQSRTYQARPDQTRLKQTRLCFRDGAAPLPLPLLSSKKPQPRRNIVI